MLNKIVITDTQTSYSEEIPFNPYKEIPEYKFENYAKHPNPAYKAIRNSFRLQGYDIENFNSKKWNPLGALIKKDFTVLIKPNLVYHTNPNDNIIFSTITHPSVIRAALDYVLLALDNTGSVFIADAPIQAANFEQIKEKIYLDEIVNSVKKYTKTKIEILDLRKEIAVKFGKIGVISRTLNIEFDEKFLRINLGKKSELSGFDFNKFRVGDYNKQKMLEFHNENKHEYIISKTALEANVIINLPKLKVHKKVGMTCSLKNLVGTVGSKDCLPHYRKGSQDEHGDEYKYKSFRKKISSNLWELSSKSPSLIKTLLISFFRFVIKFSKYIKPFEDEYFSGSWWGNNTIHRTVLDLNRILKFCDDKGVMQKEEQRIIFNIIDAIMVGEGEGPLLPSSKFLGKIISGLNGTLVDVVCANLIGFDYKKIPLIVNALKEHEWNLLESNLEETIIKSDSFEESFERFILKDFIQVKSPLGWKGHIEKK